MFDFRRIHYLFGIPPLKQNTKWLYVLKIWRGHGPLEPPLATPMSWSPDIFRITLQIMLTTAVLCFASCERSFSKVKLLVSYLRASLTSNKVSEGCVIQLRGVTIKAYFDEIIDDFASIKARKVLFKLAFLCNSTGKSWIYLCFHWIVFFKRKWYMTCIKWFAVQFKWNVFHFEKNCCLQLQYVVCLFL